MSVFVYLFQVIVGLATWIKVVLYLLVSAIAVSIAGYFGFSAAVTTAIVALFIGILLILYGALAEWVRQRKAAELRGELDDTGAKRKVLDPAVERRLKALRAAFDSGVNKIHIQGKDVYELPWFALAGETGVGKTEIMRQAELELPQNLQDREQGRGGTATLDWWFTNYAVLLDTSGELMFGFSETSTTEEWAEFSRLLLKHRHECPINGVILAISVESLLEDSTQEIERKAGIIARHLDILRTNGGLKFPVFLVLTKCDLLPGFTALAGELKDARSRQQMFGWSNPSALEAPFRPEIMEEHFHAIAQRLRRRRLNVFLDPIPQAGGSRRTDEVDMLFDLPESIIGLLPNIRLYTDNIFISGEWSSQPLFLRGVYLVSALPEVNLDLPPGALLDEQQKPFFIRDLLLDKVFREDGLVTRAGSGVLERFRRNLILFGVGILLLIVLFISSLMGYRQLSSSIEEQIGLWERGRVGWIRQIWQPIVVESPKDSGDFQYRGGDILRIPGTRGGFVSVPESSLSLMDYHRKIAETAAQPIYIPFTFRPIMLAIIRPNSGRFWAQRILFDGSVVMPLLDAARKKMAPAQGTSPVDPSEDPAVARERIEAELKALTELVRIEVNIVGNQEGKRTPYPGTTFIPSLLQYVCGPQPDTTQLINIMNWTYGANPRGVNAWAPSWTSGGPTLAKNTAINSGIDRLIAFAELRTSTLEANLATIQQFADAVTKYSDAELQLAQSASVKDEITVSSNQVANSFESLEAAKQIMEKQIEVIRSQGLFDDGPQTLSALLDNLTDGKESNLGQVDSILQEIEAVLPQVPKALAGALPTPSGSISTALLGIATSKYALLEEIKTRLTSISEMMKSNAAPQVTDQLRATYAKLDQEVLLPYDDVPSYLWRWNVYAQCAGAAQENHFSPNMYLVDARWRQLGELYNALGIIQADVDRYNGQQAQPFLTTCNYLLNRVKTIQTGLFIEAYIQQATAALQRVARFPLVGPPGPYNEALDVNQLQGAKSLLDAIALDATAPVYTNIPANTRQPVTSFISRIAPLYAVATALIKPNGSMARVTLTLYSGASQRQLSGPNFAPTAAPTPSPTPPPRSIMSTVFFGMGSAPTPPPPPPAETIDTQNWNAVSLEGNGPAGAFPVSGQSDVVMGSFNVQDAFSFRVYHSLIGDDGSDLVDGGTNWSALRLMSALGAKPLGAGQDWQLPLKPNEPNAVWMKFSFEQPLPTTPWPTVDSVGLGQVPATAAPGTVPGMDSPAGAPSP